MEQSESAQPVVFAKPSGSGKKSEFNPISIILAILLGIAFIVLVQYAISDITRTVAGEEPREPDFYSKQSSRNKNELTNQDFEQPAYTTPSYTYNYKGTVYSTDEEARRAWKKDVMLPYETTRLTTNGVIIIPMFIASLVAFLALIKSRSNYKLPAITFFGASVINTAILLFYLGTFIYEINPRIAVYAISITLIIVFIVGIAFIQKKLSEKSASNTPN